MIAWLKRLLAAKISITIVYPGGVEPIKVPTKIKNDAPFIKHVHKSNLRFIEEEKYEDNGTLRKFWFTEKWNGSRWEHVTNTLSFDKEKAMALHLKMANQEPLARIGSMTVLWQGLDSAETATWVSLQKNNTPEETSPI